MKSPKNEKCFRKKVVENTHFMFNNFFPPKILWLMRKSGKILYSRAGHRWQNGARALHAGYLRLYKHTLRICNTYCICTARVVARSHLDVKLYVQWLSCYVLFINLSFSLWILQYLLLIGFTCMANPILMYNFTFKVKFLCAPESKP
jgi:hypothetical protein